ncbi:C-type lectin domain family 5 member A-like [Elgaria multicarinata webbii]|uniref:C-type lectin domain family 5 member A-like n=1 Tax=Elgaria multicarinata webbii TaxID=159646 RepID=UPI002FCD41B4
MTWQRAAPGIILVLVKLTGTSLFLVFIPQTFPRGNISFVAEENCTVLQTTQSPPEATVTFPARSVIRTTVKATAPVLVNVPRWERYRGSEYWFSDVSDVWFNSQSECSEWNSGLVIINDKKELEFIRNKTTMGDYFIGLTYSEDENKWRWNDGTEPKWNLFTRKPDKIEQDCAIIRAQNVIPVSCYQESRWICEKNNS